MKQIFKLPLIIFAPLLFLLIACEEESPIPQRDYHQLETHDVTIMGTQNTTFNAELSFMGPEPILDYGFAWGKRRPYLNIEGSRVVSLGSRSDKGRFSATIEHPFEHTTVYYVRPYVKTETTIVYGNLVSFTKGF